MGIWFPPVFLICCTLHLQRAIPSALHANAGYFSLIKSPTPLTIMDLHECCFFNTRPYKILAMDSFFLPHFKDSGSRCSSSTFSPIIFFINVFDGSLSLSIKCQASLKFEAVIRPFLRVCQSLFEDWPSVFFQNIVYITLIDSNCFVKLVNIFLTL